MGKKPETMSKAQYNEVLLRDAYKALLEAQKRFWDAKGELELAEGHVAFAQHKLTEVFEQREMEL